MTPKLRTACDNCHRTKVRCSGQLPCQGCLGAGVLCFFSLSDRRGRPKGTRNRHAEEGRKKRSSTKAAANKTTDSNNNLESPKNDTDQQPVTPQSLSSQPVTNNNVVSTDHESNSSSASYCGSKTFDLLESQVEASLDVNSLGFDFSSLLWSEPENGFVHQLAHSGEMTVDPNPAISTVPVSTMEIPQEKQPTTTNSCTCLQQQADLLLKSKSLNNARSRNGNERSLASLDAALDLVEEGMRTWQMPIMCSSCRCDDDQEVILLAFMSIQAITRYIQRLISQTRYRLPGTPPRHNPEDCPIKHQPLSIGSFQITGDNRVLLLKTLIVNTMRKLKWILASLQKVLDEKKDRLPPPETANMTHSHMHSDVFYIQQMFNALGGSLQSLDDWLNRD